MRSPLVVPGILVVGLLFGVTGCNLDKEKERKAAEIALLEAQAERKELEAEKQKLEAATKVQQQKIDALLTQLASAKDEDARLTIMKQLDEEKAKMKGTSTGKMDTAPTPRPSAKPCNCAKDDPLCSCL